jgi:hypothetical protein
MVGRKRGFRKSSTRCWQAAVTADFSAAKNRSIWKAGHVERLSVGGSDGRWRRLCQFRDNFQISQGKIGPISYRYERITRQLTDFRAKPQHRQFGSLPCVSSRERTSGVWIRLSGANQW